MSIDFSTLQSLTIPEGVVKQIVDVNNIVIWSASGWTDLDTGLEFASTKAFTISSPTVGWNGVMEYCNGEGWKTWNGSKISSGKTKTGHCIYIRGVGNTTVSNTYPWYLTGTGVRCNGNIEKLLDYTIVNKGLHPTMAERCYYYMFSDCTSLATAPSLPATTLTKQCYYYMFRGCTSLATAPSLPATTLASGCYNSMFRGCTSLTTAPSLPATTLASSCYSGMFSDCTSLTTVPSLPATTLASSCYKSMFSGCTSLTTAPSLPATTLEYGCYNAMLRDCTSLTTVPSLPATTLADYCYYQMFRGCHSLTTVPSLPATTLAASCYYQMFYGCLKIKLSSTATDTYTKTYRIPYSGTGTTASNALTQTFSYTGGTYKSSPTINTTYYLDMSNAIV